MILAHTSYHSAFCMQIVCWHIWLLLIVEPSFAQYTHALQAAQLAMYAENYREALRYYEQVLTLNPTLAEALWGKGKAHYHLRQYEAALAVARQLKENMQDSWRCRGTWLEAFCLYEQGEASPIQRIDALQAARHCFPEDALIHVYLTQLYIAIQQPEAALQSVEQALLLTPKLAMAWALKAMLTTQNQDWQTAQQCWCRAAELAPWQATWIYNCAKLSFQQAQYETALQYIQRYTQIKPLSADDYFDIARACLQKQWYPEAVQYLQAAISLLPHRAIYYAYLAETYARMQAWTPALEANAHAIEIQGEEPTYFIQRAQLLFHAGQYKEAEPYIQFWVGQEADNPHAHYLYALYLEATQAKKRQVYRAIQKAIVHGMHPQNLPQHLQKQAWRYYRQVSSLPGKVPPQTQQDGMKLF